MFNLVLLRSLMREPPSTVSSLLAEVPLILGELAAEFLRRLQESYDLDRTSQETACLMLALRSTFLLTGMLSVLRPETWDSHEVLIRGFLETRDLLGTFRFAHKGTKQKIAYWFNGKKDSSWKAEHGKVEEYLDRLSGNRSELGRRWSMFSALSHPTMYAASNSVQVVRGWRSLNTDGSLMERKTADYLSSIGTLIVIGTLDLPDWVPLFIDPARIPHTDFFQQSVINVALPITQLTRHEELPLGSFRDS